MTGGLPAGDILKFESRLRLHNDDKIGENGRIIESMDEL